MIRKESKPLDFMGIFAEIAHRIEVATGRETSVYALSKLVGVSRSSVYYYERSPARVPVEVLLELQHRTARLGCPISDADLLDLVRSQVPRKERLPLKRKKSQRSLKG